MTDTQKAVCLMYRTGFMDTRNLSQIAKIAASTGSQGLGLPIPPPC